jgi:hypothetical protein
LPISTGGFLLRLPAERGLGVPHRIIFGLGHAADSTARLVFLGRPFIVLDDIAVVSSLDGDFRLVHHARADFLARRREEETRWGVETGSPPPERPEGRASATLYSLRGFSGRAEENRAGEVVEYLDRGVSDITEQVLLGEGGARGMITRAGAREEVGS